MSVSSIVKSRRTARVFNQNPVDINLIKDVLSLARLSPSAGNLQPIKYGIIVDEQTRKEMFPHIKYAGYIKEWNPSFFESPKAFIALFCDREKAKLYECDLGLSMMTISYLLEEKGLKSCIIGALDRPKLEKILNADETLNLSYLIGVGYSDAKSEYYDEEKEVKYSIKDDFGFRVPKKPLEDIIILEK